MNKIRFALLQMLFISAFFTIATAQQEYPISSIPDSLRKNAMAVVRSEETIFDYKSATTGTESRTLAITVLKAEGKDMSDFKYWGDRFSKLKSFSAIVYNADGKEVQKYRLSDVNITEISNALATDAVTYWFVCDTPTVPFTIVYEYEVGWSDGIKNFPIFAPQNDYEVSVQKALYTLITSDSAKISIKELNLNKGVKKSVEKEKKIYTWELSGLKAIKDEPLDGDINKYIPMVYIKPDEFVYDGSRGSIASWSDMGMWADNLLKGRDILPEQIKGKIIQMTEGASSDREKVRILYDYLGSTTRYVSIQLGIGGFQPMPAAEVSKTGFGDCKALSNYMKAMLSVIGIPSNYTIIRSDDGDPRLFKDFANFQQMNHAILQVPLPKDTLWLECTAPDVPFGFVHNNISGHDAIVVSGGVGKFVTLPDYSDSLNIESQIVKVSPQADGSAKVEIVKRCAVKIYDDYFGFAKMKSSDKADYLREQIKIPNVVMGEITVKENKSPLPDLTINYSWSTPQYGTKSGNRLFIPINPFRVTYEHLRTTERVHEIEVKCGYKDVDTIYIAIPEGYEVENVPAAVLENTPFGNFSFQLIKDEKGITISQRLFIPSGKYSSEKYKEFTALFDKVSAAYKAKIVLKKKAL